MKNLILYQDKTHRIYKPDNNLTQTNYLAEKLIQITVAKRRSPLDFKGHRCEDAVKDILVGSGEHGYVIKCRKLWLWLRCHSDHC